MKSYCLLLALLLSQVILIGQERPNLFPNGDVENEMSTLFLMDREYRSYIKTDEKNMPSFWKLSEGATLSKDGYAGGNAIKINNQEKKVTATVFSNFWRVEDTDMPFGLPLAPEQEITISFRYRTSGLQDKKTFVALIQLGVLKNQPTKELLLELPVSKEWKMITKKIILSELKWGCKIEFSLDGDKENKGVVWIDDVYLGQALDGINLVNNHSFEEEDSSSTIPHDWQIPVEDQWVSWVGTRYREPVIDKDESISGHNSLRADVVYADGSGVSQRIFLNQQKIKPVVIELWSKLNNTINSKAGYPVSSDSYSNLTVYVYHQDGTMQEVSPILSLGQADHDWEFRRFGFMTQKPVKEILIQMTVLGSEYTTSLWLDEVKTYELGTNAEELRLRGVDFPPRTVWSKWGSDKQLLNCTELQVMNDDKNLYMTIPNIYNQEISIYLNPRTKSDFVNHFRYLFDVIKITADGAVYKGTTIEKQGYTADGKFSLASKAGVKSYKSGSKYQITIPFKVLEISGIQTDPFGFNVMWQNGDQKIYWNGKAANNKEMGRIILSRAPSIRIKSIKFGNRYDKVKEQTNDFVSQPPLYAGKNQADIILINDGPECQAELVAGIEDEHMEVKNILLKHQEVRHVALDYQAGLERLTSFNVTLSVNGEQKIAQSYPIEVPSAIEIVLDQEFYYLEEDSAYIEIHNRYRPIPEEGKVQIEVTDLKDHRIIQSFSRKLTDTISVIPLSINNIRVNSLPVQDYSVTVRYFDKGQKILGVQTKNFGRINHTKRRKLPPINNLTIDDKHRIIINGDFRFFPIIVSDHIKEWGAGIDMGANVFKSCYVKKDSTDYKDRDKAWEKNAYTLFIGPYSPEEFDQFESEDESLIIHPGVLGTYNHQFYYWKLTDEWINFRKRVENFMGKLSSPRLVIWGHHDSSFLYDLDLPEWPNTNKPPVGYCYVKIMSRPGSAWRNTPFLTRTEQVINPGRFKLAEVNYYVSGHYDEISPLNISSNVSLRPDDWHGVRNESYLSIIYGATGLYHWIIMKDKKIERLRGWFQELNYMWPVFVADDAENKVEILPFDSKLDTRLKKWHGKYYLLVANRRQTVQQATIHIDGFKNMKVKKLFELTGDMSINGNLINDVWRRYDVHVYEIEE